MKLPILGGNWIDLLVIVVVLYFIAQAFRIGFWAMLTDFLYLLFATIVALFSYQFAADFFRSNFSITYSFSNTLGFLLVAVISGAFFAYFFTFLIGKVPEKYLKSRWGYPLAIIPAVGEAIVVIAFILTLIIGLPISPSIKSDISNSKLGGFIIKNTSGVNARINDVFGKTIEDSLTYLTIQPESREVIQLNVGEKVLSIDKRSETEMHQLVNNARAKRGLESLEWSEDIAQVSRAYALDLWERNYFGHYSPEGENVADRLKSAQIPYVYAGENIAMAPTVSIAQAGLMNSQGHRKNILDINYKKIGIGVIDNGIYGKMYVQVFTN